MNSAKPDFYLSYLHIAAEKLQQAISASLPCTSVQHFMLWLLDPTHSHQEDYLRMMGVAGSVELEKKLFEQVLSDNQQRQIAPYIGNLNAYFAYETLSDNLGVGLGLSAKKTNPFYREQITVLHTFNRTMVQNLNSEKLNLGPALESIHAEIKKISVNQKSLDPLKMQQFVQDYQKEHPQIKPEELEHSFWEILILNLYTGKQLLQSMQLNPIYSLLKKSLIARYTSVNQLLSSGWQRNSKNLASLGLASILVVPTLAYCLGALHEIEPNPQFRTVIRSGLLYKAMANAALLTRLLNDIGPLLLKMPQTERAHFLDVLYQAGRHNQCQTLLEGLDYLSHQNQFCLPLTRICKDIEQGEFNLCLDLMTSHDSFKLNFKQFRQNLEYYAQLYQRRSKCLTQQLGQLSTILQTEQYSQIIGYFVSFHEYKYQHFYASREGDYAITTQEDLSFQLMQSQRFKEQHVLHQSK